MSRPDRIPRVAVDFAPPARSGQSRRPLVALALVVVLLAVLLVAVTQLILR